MFCLNVDNMMWRRIFSLEGPPPRLYGSFVNMGSRKYLIGGNSLPDNVVLNDIWSLSLENVMWSSSSLELPGLLWSKVDLAQEGMRLPCLKGHDAIKVSDNLIFIFGGYNRNGEVTDVSLLLDTDERKLINFETKGHKPTPRAFHKMLPVKENIICLYGGVSSSDDNTKNNSIAMLSDFYLLNLDDGYWSNPIIGGYTPLPKTSFCISGNQSDFSAQIYLLGGKLRDSSIDYTLHILEEVDPSRGEVWSIKNEFSSTEVAHSSHLASNDQAKVIKELAQAESLINEQKNRIGDLETMIRRVREEFGQKEEQRKVMQKRIEQTKTETDGRIAEMNQKLDERTKRNEQNKDLLEQLKRLTCLEKKRRKLLEAKSHLLQNIFKSSENLIITVDVFINRALQGELLENYLPEDIMDRLAAMKLDHKTNLLTFKESFDVVVKKEESIKQGTKSQKQFVKENLPQYKSYASSLYNDEERKLLNVQPLD